ncbi:hypothetical protein BABINDRAFT_163411 [Babjeviella inositovora NRRL Y-12698]|uniref:Uncharacterized protein n=1 Tax=Babjeviella inositovora NRRL Y-12698 TaxID=984486 RepID=A0A1E3QJ10_9ASCO|nr:uncharacterized protein BABINDRAFT_163411 [Babjeviella inositovora NRRL Y-12698]ODQ77703.1 hypothetical protein BABINDRAFT_163411 [Babjeviella inositovora NRRL Y-12698]
MSEEEAILNGLNETEAEGLLEIYVRMNGDCEKDYCFTISVNDRFQDLHKIFDTLPLALRPSILYHLKPVAFQISTHPGFLTRDGGLLHTYDADKPQYLKSVDQNEKIADHVWPGQLIVPLWERNLQTQLVLISVLGLWLYTDLPDFISPTPGICMTNQFTRFCAYLVSSLGYDDMANTLLDEMHNDMGEGGQIAFFAFHVVKAAILTLIIWSGIFNPYTFTPMGRFSKMKTVKDLTREELLAIGWTGSRHATTDEYKEYFKETRVKQYGGIIGASRAGVFQEMSTMGVQLGPGEGFDTPVTEASGKLSLEAMRKSEKFVLNYEYLAALGEVFEAQIDALTDIKLLAQAVKDYRRYGPMASSEKVHELYLQRKMLGNGKISVTEAN